MIREAIIGTRAPGGAVHLAPMGVRRQDKRFLLAPYRPSRTLENLRAHPEAVVNFCDDVRVFAGCLTGRADWPTTSSAVVGVPRLRDALAHSELRVLECEEDPERPRFSCQEVHAEGHLPFRGFNRAQAAVIEAAILVSRLHLLSAAEVDRGLASLGVAVEKTAGERELLAWEWLLARVREHRAPERAGGSAPP